MRLFIGVYIILLFFSLKLEAHPLHVSIVNADINLDSSKISYSIRLFYDDFQALINHKYNTFIDFGKQQRMTTKEQSCMVKYLNESFLIDLKNNEHKTPDFIGWKKEDVSIWLYFTFTFKSCNPIITIENRLMFELFTDQKNLMVLNIDGKEVALEFNQRINKHEIRI